MYLLFVFFKQKTGYEVRISDWSSDVCSSDLLELVDNQTREMTILREDVGQKREHFLVAQALRPLLDDEARAIEQLLRYDGRKCLVAPDPFGWIIADMPSFQLEGRAAPDIVASIFFVDEDLVDCASRP